MPFIVPGLHREEIRGPQGGGVPRELVVPGSFGALEPRIEPGLLQDVDDRGAADVADAELLEFAEDADVTRAILIGKPQHEFADRGRTKQPSCRSDPMRLSFQRTNRWCADRQNPLFSFATVIHKKHCVRPVILHDSAIKIGVTVQPRAHACPLSPIGL